MSATQLLDRLERVKVSAPGRWIARCPAHTDRSPSLSVRELEDGRVLLHCFAGCESGDVLSAIGLTMSDLFPARPREHGYAAAQTAIPARELLIILDHEITVAALILNDAVTRRAVSQSDVQRLMQAAARIGKARDMANPSMVPHVA